MNIVLGNQNNYQNLANLYSGNFSSITNVNYSQIVSLFPNIVNLDIKEIIIQVNSASSGIICFQNSYLTPAQNGPFLQNGDTVVLSFTELISTLFHTNGVSVDFYFLIKGFPKQ